jgi:phosphopantothenoylcysteine decarboxylase/phosphopantothenate--cysteine ligase
VVSVFSAKKIVVGVSGSIAAFKVAGWVSELAKEEAQVLVIMTDSACRFITPLTFAALSGKEVFTGMFSEKPDHLMAHIDLGRDADLFVIAPATANCMARLALGLADDLLSTTALAARCEVVVFPAMNSRMYAHPATQANINKLRQLGYTVIDPDSGMMACKEQGKGRLVEWADAREVIASTLSPKDLTGEHFLITAGPTREALDPARFLSNRSSGKMGYALARCARRRGAEVTLISGPTGLTAPPGITCIQVESAQEMYLATVKEAERCSVIIKAAAVADYCAREYSQHKVKKDQIESNLPLARTPDILLHLGENRKSGQLLVGFAAESRNHLEEGEKKLISKKLDLIAVNNIAGAETGFEVDTNQVILLDRRGSTILPHTSKIHTADLILDKVLELRNSS